jgi:hypothetical protein
MNLAGAFSENPQPTHGLKIRPQREKPTTSATLSSPKGGEGWGEEIIRVQGTKL